MTRAAFTLLEVLITLFIFALVVTGTLAAYRRTLVDLEHLREQAHYLETARNCLDRITRDVSNLHVALHPVYQPPRPGGSSDPWRIVSTPDFRAGPALNNLRFTTRTHLNFDGFPPGLARVWYFTEPRSDDRLSDGTMVLRRAHQVFPHHQSNDADHNPPPLWDAAAAWPVICENLAALQFSFVDSQGQEHDTWDSDSRKHGYATPVALHIELTFTLNHDLETAPSADSHQHVHTRLVLPVHRPPVN